VGEVTEKVMVLLNSLDVDRSNYSTIETLNEILEVVSKLERSTIKKRHERKYTAYEIGWVEERIGKIIAKEIKQEFERLFDGKTISKGTIDGIRRGVVKPMDSEEIQENSYRIEPYKLEDEPPVEELRIVEVPKPITEISVVEMD
jgi:hypothetical protein